MNPLPKFTVVVPAAGVGKRMQASKPKQYLNLIDKTVIEHTLNTLINHPRIDHVVVAVSKDDPYFDTLDIAGKSWLTRVEGGQERADSVLAGLKAVTNQSWVLVHDAARPCLTHHDLDQLIALADAGNIGGILACPVRDTMKRAQAVNPCNVEFTENRNNLWHALTPQFFPYNQLYNALEAGLNNGTNITDEASAIEMAGGEVRLIEGSMSNLKITRPDDLALAEFYLTNRNNECE